LAEPTPKGEVGQRQRGKDADGEIAQGDKQHRVGGDGSPQGGPGALIGGLGVAAVRSV